MLSSPSENISRFGPFLLFLLLPFLAFPEIIFGGQTLYKTDITWIHYPGNIFLAEEWWAGRVPLWDPYRQAGVPMLAEPQIGVLYPFRALFLSSLSPSLEFSLFTLLHFTLAAGFTYALARSLSQGRAAATVSGLAFGFGGVLMAQVPNSNIMTTVVWLPLVLYAAILMARKRSWLGAMLAGLGLAVQILAAHSQIVFYTLVSVIGYGLYKIVVDLFRGTEPQRGHLQNALHTGLLLALMISTGFLIGAPQLLPSLELIQLTSRSLDRGLDLLTENSLPPFMWLNLLVPSAFGNNVVGFKGGDPFQEDFIYVGFIPLVLACLSLMTLGERTQSRRKAAVLFFILLFVGGTMMASGRYTPLYRYVIQYLPGFDLFRIPARWLMVSNLALAILAGFGLEKLLVQGISRTGWGILLLINLLILAGLGLIWFFSTELLVWSSTLASPFPKLIATFLDVGFKVDPEYRNRLLLSQVILLTVPVFLLAANIAVTVALFTLFFVRRLSGRGLAVLVVAAVSVDLVLAGGTTINPIKPASWWQRISGGAKYVLEHLDNRRVFPLGVNTEEWGGTHLGQYYPSRYRVHSAGGYASPLRLARYDTLLDDADPVQGLQVLGVRYLLTPGQMGADVAATFPLVFSDETSYVYENKNAPPRAFVVHRAVLADDPDEALAYLNDRSLDFGRVVVLEPDQGVVAPAPAASDDLESTAVIVSDNPQMLEIHVELAGAGYLVLLDTYYPGWAATVDGHTATIFRADYIGRAVFVPAGEHTVRFEYRPLSFRVGVGLALLALTALSAAIVVTKLRTRRQSSHPFSGRSES